MSAKHFRLVLTMMAEDHIASPISTGAAGPMFEQHVDAFFLAMLLLRGIPPVLLDCQLEALHLQASHLGWHTDDLVLVGSSSSGKRRLAIQVKRQLTIGARDPECQKTFRALWNDFVGDAFTVDRD